MTKLQVSTYLRSRHITPKGKLYTTPRFWHDSRKSCRSAHRLLVRLAKAVGFQGLTLSDPSWQIAYRWQEVAELKVYVNVRTRVVHLSSLRLKFSSGKEMRSKLALTLVACFLFGKWCIDNFQNSVNEPEATKKCHRKIFNILSYSSGSSIELP